MTSSFSASLRLNEQGTNDNPSTWGLTLNNGVIALLDDAIAGISNVDMTGVSDVNIASTVANGAVDVARHAILKLTGTMGGNLNLIIPSVPKIYVIWATQAGGTATVKTNSGLGVSLVQGEQALLFCDGTDTYLVSSNQTVAAFPSGGIVMWSGTISSIPAAWALCDGSNGTPDLRDRFIVGARQDSGGVAKTNITGALTQSGGSLANTTTDSQGSHSHTGLTGSHALSIPEMPAHSHTLQMRSPAIYDITGNNTAINNGSPTNTTFTTDISGSGAGHTHTISTDGAHTHTVTVNTQPYFALAYIMKL